MGDVMRFGVLSQPLDMVVSNPLGWNAFHSHAQETLADWQRLYAENEQLKAGAQELVAALELAYREILVYRTPTQWSEYRNGALDMVKDAIEKHKGTS